MTTELEVTDDCEHEFHGPDATITMRCRNGRCRLLVAFTETAAAADRRLSFLLRQSDDRGLPVGPAFVACREELPADRVARGLITRSLPAAFDCDLARRCYLRVEAV